MDTEKKATIVATTTAFCLAVTKLTIGLISGSVSVMASAIDSLLDMGISLFNIVAVHNAKKDPDDQFNYGRWKMEALAAFLEGVIISLSAVYIAYQSIAKFIYQEPIVEVGAGVIVMIISVIVTGALVTYLQGIAQKSKNIVITSDILHYKTDLLSNMAILVGLVMVSLSGWYQVDAILGIFIAIYIAYSAFDIVKKWILLLLDVSLDEMHVEQILRTIDAHKSVKSFHEFRTRISGGTKFVEAHLVFSPEISLLEAHKISHLIEDEIRNIDRTSEWSILFHLDPYDDEATDKISKK